MRPGGHIILAEDEALSAMFLELALRDRGYAVSTVASGEKALSVFEERGADMLLLDIHLSGMKNGIDVAREIQSRASVQTVFMTGYSKESMDGDLEGIETAAFLSKPVDINMLVRVLEEAAG